jgi:hypothetical protein
LRCLQSWMLAIYYEKLIVLRRQFVKDLLDYGSAIVNGSLVITSKLSKGIIFSGGTHSA